MYEQLGQFMQSLIMGQHLAQEAAVPIYREVSRIFEDAEHGHRIQIRATFTKLRTNDTDTIYVTATYLPPQNQEIRDFLAQHGADVEAYDAQKSENPAIDNEIRKKGIRLGCDMNTGVMDFFDADDIRNNIQANLGSALSDKTYQAIDRFIKKEFSVEALVQAKSAWQRTNGHEQLNTQQVRA